MEPLAGAMLVDCAGAGVGDIGGADCPAATRIAVVKAKAASAGSRRNGVLLIGEFSLAPAVVYATPSKEIFSKALSGLLIGNYRGSGQMAGSQPLGQKCSSGQARRRWAAASGVMSRCGIPSISKPTMNLRTVAERSSGG